MNTTNNLEKEVKKRKQQFFEYTNELNFSAELAKKHWSSEHEKLLKKNGEYRKDSLRKLENFLIVYDSIIRVKNNSRPLPEPWLYGKFMDTSCLVF